MTTAEATAVQRTSIVSDSYHDDYSAVSKTMLNLFFDSRLEYYHTYVTRQLPPKPQSKPMLVGTVLHAMLLEDRMFSDMVLPYPPEALNKNGNLLPGREAAYKAEYPEINFLKQAECDNIRATVDAVLKQPALCDLIKQATHREQRFDAHIEGVPCKCKPDIVCDLGDRIVVYDLKFMDAVDPESWRRSSKRFRYWLQDIHYSSVLSKHFLGKPVQFQFALIECKFPHRIQMRWFDQASKATARDEHRKKLRELAVCHSSGDWEDEWNGPYVLTPWDMKCDELVEVDQ